MINRHILFAMSLMIMSACSQRRGLSLQLPECNLPHIVISNYHDGYILNLTVNNEPVLATKGHSLKTWMNYPLRPGENTALLSVNALGDCRVYFGFAVVQHGQVTTSKIIDCQIKAGKSQIQPIAFELENLNLPDYKFQAITPNNKDKSVSDSIKYVMLLAQAFQSRNYQNVIDLFEDGAPLPFGLPKSAAGTALTVTDVVKGGELDVIAGDHFVMVQRKVASLESSGKFHLVEMYNPELKVMYSLKSILFGYINGQLVYVDGSGNCLKLK